MEEDDFKVGDRVGRYFGNVIEKGYIEEIENGLYTIHFENPDLIDLVTDGEKIFKIGE